MAFFPSLIHTGTRVGGQRERQTQAFESSLPFFPRDYPSTPTYDTFADERADEEEERWEKKPRAKRPSWEKLGVRSPWKPDWDVVLGLKEPQLFREREKVDHDEENDDDDELLAADRSEDEMDIEPQAEDETSSRSPWLLRGPAVASLINSVANLEDAANVRAEALLRLIDEGRAKRSLPPLLGQTSDAYTSPAVSPEDVYGSALVRVALRLLGRGCPSDMAIIYGMTDEEVLAHDQAKSQHEEEPVDIDAESEVRMLSINEPSNAQFPSICSQRSLYLPTRTLLAT